VQLVGDATVKELPVELDEQRVDLGVVELVLLVAAGAVVVADVQDRDAELADPEALAQRLLLARQVPAEVLHLVLLELKSNRGGEHGRQRRQLLQQVLHGRNHVVFEQLEHDVLVDAQRLEQDLQRGLEVRQSLHVLQVLKG